MLLFVRNISKFVSIRRTHHFTSAKYKQTLINLPETRVTEIENGFKIASQVTDTPISTVGVWIDAGSRYETTKNNGVSNFIKQLIFKGSNARTRHNLEVQSLGVKFSSYITQEETAFYTKCLSVDVLKVVDILGDAIVNAKFEDDIIEGERGNILHHLQEAELDLRQVTLHHLHSIAYQGSPLSYSVFGPTENIKKLSKEDITFHLRNSFVAPRMVLCVSGNIDHDELVKAAEKQFRAVPYTYTGEIPLLRPCRFTGSEVRVRDDWLPCAHVAITIDACGLDSPDIYPLMIAKALVGNWDKTSTSSANTYNSLVQNIYKEKGCYSFESFHTLYRDCGLWGCYFVVEKMLLDDFIFNLQNEWMKLCINVSEADLILAKSKLCTDLMLHFEDSTNVCSYMGREILLSGEVLTLEEIEQKIQDVTLSCLRDTCLKYIYDRCPAVAAVGPVEGLPDYNRVRSGMYRIRY